VVLYDYKPVSNIETAVRKGDAVTVYKSADNWLLVECREQRGWVPEAYVEILGDAVSSFVFVFYFYLELMHFILGCFL
jgi:hypothetical protein